MPFANDNKANSGFHVKESNDQEVVDSNPTGGNF